MANTPLFDNDVERVPPPKRPTEGDFAFLNRAAGTPWDALRDLYETWYRDYPDPDNDLRNRFRSGLRSQHVGAWWELYIFTLFRRLGYDVTPHPEMPGTTKRPDFLVIRDGVETVVECAAMLDEDGWVDSDAVSWVLECINNAKSATFRVGVGFTVEGLQRPKRTKIIGAVEKWLNSLDADSAYQRFQANPRDTPSTEITVGDWVVALDAYPVPPERRGSDSGLIWRWPMKTGVLNHKEQIDAILSNKGSRYGQLPVPLVVALLAWPITADEFHMANSLYGALTVNVTVDDDGQLRAESTTRNVDGYWRPGPNPGGTRTSGVLLGPRLRPDLPFTTLPQLWINPWATVPLPGLPPLETVTLIDEHLDTQDALTTAENLFGQAPHWPHEPRYQ